RKKTLRRLRAAQHWAMTIVIDLRARVHRALSGCPGHRRARMLHRAVRHLARPRRWRLTAGGGRDENQGYNLPGERQRDEHARARTEQTHISPRWSFGRS